MQKLLLYFILIIGALIFLYPFLWMISATLKPEIEISGIGLWSSNLSFESYTKVFDKIPIGRSFLNSLLVSCSVTASVLIFGSIVGYALSRLEFAGRNLIFLVVLFTMMIPFQITLIPTYILMVKFKLVDTYLSLMLPGFMSAFGILLFRQFFKSIPQALIDSARIDGCTELGILFRIIWPLSKPTLITVGLITFMTNWNEVLWPLIVIRERELMTMPQMVAIFQTGGQAESLLGVKLAAATLLALPVVIAYVIFQRYFIESMATTGIKN